MAPGKPGATAGGAAGIGRRQWRHLRDAPRFTAVYATLWPKVDGAVPVVVCSGGHPPGLVLRDDESVEVLDRAPGMLLGVFPTVELSDQ